MHAALREKLFASVVHLLGNRWHCVSDKKKNDWFLTGISQDDLILMLCFSSLSNHLFRCPITSVNFYFSLYVLFDRHV